MATKKKVSVKKEKVEKKKGDFRFEVMVNDVHFKTQTATLAEALDEFIKSGDFPFAIKTKVILRYGSGDNIVQKLWPLAEARRVFATMDAKPESVALFGEILTRRL